MALFPSNALFSQDNMTHRTLRDMTYREGIPMSGRCTVCGQRFRTPAHALADPQKATWDFYRAFDLHECTVQTLATQC